jgi:hypothetical protein
MESAIPEDFKDRSVVRVFNPCYQEGSDVEEIIAISNGDMVNFADSGVVGKVIRAASRLNVVDNPLGLSHSGMAFLQNPRQVFDIILELTPNFENQGVGCQIREKAGNAMMDEILAFYHSELALVDYDGVTPFLFESNGDAGAVLKGIAPHVQIHPFLNSLESYSGNVYLRPINADIPVEYSTEFIRKYIGRSYETFSTVSELARATIGANKKEKTDKVFCSELAGIFYRDVIETFYWRSDPIVERLRLYENVSNIIPEQFGSGAGDRDLLQCIAGPELTLKHSLDLRLQEAADKSEEGKCCVLI